MTDIIVNNARSDYRMFPPNKKHLWRGFYLPSMRGEEISIMFGCDVSGSISDVEIQEALSEVKGICEQFPDYCIYLRVFDTEIHNRWELHPFDAVPRVVTGRGGTDFDEIDCEANFPPEPRGVPVISLSVGNRKPPFGLLIEYPRKEK